MLDVFRFDPNFDENELLWEQIKKEILGDDDDEDEEEDGEGEDREGGGQGSD
jgi:pre-mRNA-splicing factor CWC22